MLNTAHEPARVLSTESGGRPPTPRPQSRALVTRDGWQLTDCDGISIRRDMTDMRIAHRYRYRPHSLFSATCTGMFAKEDHASIADNFSHEQSTNPVPESAASKEELSSSCQKRNSPRVAKGELHEAVARGHVITWSQTGSSQAPREPLVAAGVNVHNHTRRPESPQLITRCMPSRRRAGACGGSRTCR